MMLLSALIALSYIAPAASHLIEVDINFETSMFSIVLLENKEMQEEKRKWFESGDTFFHANGGLFTTSDGSLKLSTVDRAYGADTLGDFSQYILHFISNSNLEMIGEINIYENFVVFDQHFPQNLSECSTGNADSLVSSFPSFSMKSMSASEPTSMGYAHWVSWFYETSVSYEVRRRALVAPGFLSPIFGSWDGTTQVLGGIGGTGVTCVYDQVGETAVVLSPMENVMAMSHLSPVPGSFQVGIMGNVTDVPSDVSFKTIMFVGQSGINNAMADWGSTMRRYFGKNSAAEARASDITLQYLGFTTDNGAYYYYNTEPGKDYEQTLIDVKQYADTEGIPYKYILLDSWWYYKGENGGVSDWTAMPEIFPNGLEALYNATGWVVQAHNRYWALDNIYTKTNGGAYEFVEDSIKQGSVPAEESLWEQLMDTPANKWGLVVYEQDWLFNEFYEYVGQMLESVSLGRSWLTQMGNVAAKKGIKIQYCMPFIRHLLMSLEVPVVTQARSSDDYVVAPYDGVDVANWRIGGQTMLMEALGLASSKDGFWSTSYQPGNPYGVERYEPYPRLESVVATLSAGPIAIADGIGFSDSELIMMSCMKDGSLLQPSTPAIMIDAQILQSTFGVSLSSPIGPQGEVWAAFSTVSGYETAYIFVADLLVDWKISPGDIFKGSRAPHAPLQYYVSEANSSANIWKWSEAEPLALHACGFSDFALWTAIPVLNNGWGFRGELNKWVGVASIRFESLRAGIQNGISVVAKGSAGEVLEVGFVSPEMQLIVVSCTILDGHDRVIINSDGSCILFNVVP